MDVTVNNALKAYGAYNAEFAAAANRVNRTNEKPGTTESKGVAGDFDSILQAVKDSPDMHGDKVADIKSRVAHGSYHISSSAVANKILGEFYKTNG
ncbi:MAG: flagellar biosynthesis anti-sigma factor FlgM [Defluviitaleaceae bacterium]|nr:flagellar biosynthesis anti-sigma factor FlgM [Defluviitaleaceae bacterium]